MKLHMRPILLASLFLPLVACGRKGPLIYPDMMIPAAPTALSVRQSGSSLRLQFTIPDKDRGGRTLQGLSGVKISRKASDVEDKAVCRSCLTDYTLFKTIYLDLLPIDSQRYGRLLIVRDSDVAPGKTYSYGILPFTTDGVEGVLSISPTTTMVAEVAAPSLAVAGHPTEVKLQVTPQLQVTERLIGLNFYRWQENRARSFRPLNSEPYKGNEYADTSLERGVKYSYTASKVVMELESGNIVESAESAAVAGMLKDDE